MKPETTINHKKTQFSGRSVLFCHFQLRLLLLQMCLSFPNLARTGEVGRTTCHLVHFSMCGYSLKKIIYIYKPSLGKEETCEPKTLCPPLASECITQCAVSEPLVAFPRSLGGEEWAAPPKFDGEDCKDGGVFPLKGPFFLEMLGVYWW